jgi:hypothetical protein
MIELTVIVGLAQIVALAGIFVRIGKVLEKSSTNQKKISKLYKRVRNLENHVRE